MISYHPDSKGRPVGTTFTAGFKTVDTDDPERIAKGVVQYAWSPSVFRDGYRDKSHFQLADWMALDFDSPEMSLAEAVNSFSDMIHVIGTTRSHMKEKRGVICERFRVIMRLERRVDTAAVFEATVKPYLRRYPVDAACLNAAAHYFPCRDVVSVVSDGMTVDVVAPPPPDVSAARAHFSRMQHKRFGTLPPWLRSFLDSGRLCRGCARNQTIYAAAYELALLGYSREDAEILIRRAPIDRRDLSDFEMNRTIHSAFKRGSPVERTDDASHGQLPGQRCDAPGSRQTAEQAPRG